MKNQYNWQKNEESVQLTKNVNNMVIFFFLSEYQIFECTKKKKGGIPLLAYHSDNYTMLLYCLNWLLFVSLPFLIIFVQIKSFWINGQLVFWAFLIITSNIFSDRPSFVFLRHFAFEAIVVNIVVMLQPVEQVMNVVITSPRVVSQPQYF